MIHLIILKRIKKYTDGQIIILVFRSHFYLHLMCLSTVVVSQCFQVVWHHKKKMPKFSIQSNFAFDSVILNVGENTTTFQGLIRDFGDLSRMDAVQGLSKDST